ncbi:hypothetical protein FEM48_Zijuj07G0061000 [Ziziphus jujuba var. spinosa]|uniref:Uncharacterized protein n=1 Tax=Ziziphus jujuba var. spinosa TaxID=714518 RepID=A0A978V2X1_ZIZJJ|nr:hypothetical protein FEM48_Zijuj07G0061000 [Ziziphus jujuba var. spinosa]
MNEIKFDYTRVLDNLKAVRERGITIDNATRELETDKYHSLSLMLMRIETLWRTGSWADCALLFFVYTLGVKQMICCFNKSGVTTIIDYQIWTTTWAPIESSLGTPPVLLEGLTLPGEDGGAVTGYGSSGVVSGGEDVAGALEDFGADSREGLDEYGGLDGHVERAGDFGSFEGLRNGHFDLGELDSETADISLREAVDLVFSAGGCPLDEKSHGYIRDFFLLGGRVGVGRRNSLASHETGHFDLGELDFETPDIGLRQAFRSRRARFRDGRHRPERVVDLVFSAGGCPLDEQSHGHIRELGGLR